MTSLGQDEFVAMIHAQNEQCAMAVGQRAGNHQALSGCCCESETGAECFASTRDSDLCPYSSSLQHGAQVCCS
jgi:hypothetical protein